MNLNRFISTTHGSHLLAHGVSALAAKPNVIIILIDDMGWADSSTHGSEYYQTPNLAEISFQ